MGDIHWLGLFDLNKSAIYITYCLWIWVIKLWHKILSFKYLQGLWGDFQRKDAYDKPYPHWSSSVSPLNTVISTRTLLRLIWGPLRSGLKHFRGRDWRSRWILPIVLLEKLLKDLPRLVHHLLIRSMQYHVLRCRMELCTSQMRL